VLTTCVVVNHGQYIGRLAVHLGLNKKFFARQSFDRVTDPLKSCGRIPPVHVGDALIVGVVDEFVETIPTEGGLRPSAVAAGPKAQPAEF